RPHAAAPSRHTTLSRSRTPLAITEIELRPEIHVRDADVARVAALVAEDHDQCYGAHSLRTEVRVRPSIEVVAGRTSACGAGGPPERKSTRLNSSHVRIS